MVYGQKISIGQKALESLLTIAFYTLAGSLRQLGMISDLAAYSEKP
jgi:hypothetical protein